MFCYLVLLFEKKVCMTANDGDIINKRLSKNMASVPVIAKPLRQKTAFDTNFTV